MRKLFLVLILSLICVPVQAAKWTEYTNDSAPTDDDIVATVNDPGGSPGNRKVTVKNLFKRPTGTYVGLGDSAGRLIFQDETIDKLNIMSAYVGIGKTNPSYILDVQGTTRISGTDGIIMDAGLAYKTGTTFGDTALLSAYDTDAAVYSTMATLTAGAIPTISINSPVITGIIPVTPRQGEFGYDSATQKAFKYGASGLTQMMSGVFFTSTADATVASSTTETSIIGTGVGWVNSGTLKSIPTGFFATGKTMRITVNGYITNTSTPTIRIRLNLGGTAICDTTAVTMSNITGNGLFTAEFIVTARSIGSSGTVMAQGFFQYNTAASTTVRIQSAQTTTSTIDMTASQALDVTATWGTSSSSNSITSTNVIMEVLN